MTNWRRSNQFKTHFNPVHTLGVELSLSELMNCKLLAEALVLPSQQKVKTHLLGGFMSSFKGRGMDFDEARPYQMGDDIRSIDWRVTARTGEAHTKIYREERERPVFVILDQSASMMFGTRQLFKSVQAAKLAATIMWKTLKDGHRFGGLLFSETFNNEFKPSSSRKNCLRLLNQIVSNHNQQIQSLYKTESTNLDHASSLSATLFRARHLIKPGSLIFLISDFVDFDDECEHHALRLAQHNDVQMIGVYDPIEKELPPPGEYTITDGLQRDKLNTQNAEFRAAYQLSFNNRTHKLETICQKHRMNWFSVGTQQLLNELLIRIV